MFKNCKVVAKNYCPTDYHKLNAERGSKDLIMSSSKIRAVFEKSPSAWINGWSRAGSDSMDYGSLLDCVFLTPDHFDSRYAIEPEKYEAKGMECPYCKSVTDSKKCAKCKADRIEIIISKDWNYQSDVCKEWRASQIADGKEVASNSSIENAKAAMKRLSYDSIIKDFVDGCDKQVFVTGEWADEATGLVIPMQCLIDLVGKEDGPYRKRLGDLKTTKNGSVIAWARWADTVGYSLQAAIYLDMFNNACPERELTDFCFVLSENSAPWETGRRYMSQDLDNPGQDEGSIASGRRQYRKMMAGYCQCVKSGKWPGFDDTDEASSSGWTLVIPDPWAENRRLFEPKFSFGGTQEEPAQEPDEENFDVQP